MAIAIAGCTSVQQVRLQPDVVDVGSNHRPIAGIQANATSWYFLFIPIPGNVDLDTIVNKLLIVTAKTMGADKITNLQFESTPSGGIWALRKLLFWRSAQASGVAVQVLSPPPDPTADEGPEPSPSPSPVSEGPPGASDKQP